MYKTIKITSNNHPILFIKSFVILIIFILLPFLSKCQKTKNIYQSISDYRGYSIFYTAKSIPQMDFNPSVDYYWFIENEIHTTKGAMGGKLLNGEFVTYYLNNNLKEKGSFYYGLKNNKWQYWFANGNIQKTENYRDGLLEGSYCVYNERNQIIISGQYKNNKKNGIWYTYDNNTGKQLNTYTWKNGIQNGEFIIYDDYTIVKGNYNKGRLNGKYIITKNKNDSILYFKNGVEYLKKPKIKKTKPSVKVEKPLRQTSKDTLSTAKKTNKFSFKKLFHSKNKEKESKADNKEKITKADKGVSTDRNVKKSTKKKCFFGLFTKIQKPDNNDTIPIKNPDPKSTHK